MDELISQADFNMRDFLRTRKSSVVGVGDVREVLEIYERELRGSSRKKCSKTKVERVENSLTPTGLKKLTDARKTLRMSLEASHRRVQRSEKLPPIQPDIATENYGFDDRPDEFIHKMQKWGEFPVGDRRYYLHMVFRYYFKQYHDYAVSKGAVIPHPSYQFILDKMFPNDCANRFPPEFRRFLVDSAGRKIAIHSLPVPVKGSAQDVTYEFNFEAIPHVSTLRRKIENIVLDWKYRKKSCEVYPPYLCKGNEFNNLIVERECYARKVGQVKQGLGRIAVVLGEDLSKLESVAVSVPAALTAYDDYTLHGFKTQGEQLKERLGFFMRSTYREIFYALNKFALADDLFVASGAGMEVFVAFQTFCTHKAKGVAMPFERDDCVCRALLMVVVDVCFFFHVFKNRALANEDSSKIIVDVIQEISGKSRAI